MTDSHGYDRFASFYDVSTLGDLFYRQARQQAVEELRLSSGSVVADVFCGTGVDFDRLHWQIGNRGRILAIDGSPEMLKQAGSRRERLGIDDDCLDFREADLAAPGGIDEIVDYIDDQQPRHILFSLGLTCLDNWRDLTSAVFDAVQPGTRLAIMDVYSERLTLGARLINWIGAADCRRPVWKALQERCESFEWSAFRPFKVLDVSVFVASGTKPTA
ncbi:class I SAM-dependent methyltransferase [Salinisphaera orenii]|uniref:class I SAM-dependent methyltransferase n=1 Tax=Salinisphaera orenii TaxID=856731 RepID=UPI000DBE7D12